MRDPLETLAARCLMPGFIGTAAPDWVLRRAAEGLGALVIYGRNVESPEQLESLAASLHAQRPELLIAIDEEGGDVTRLESRTGSSYPGNLALGSAGDSRLTRAVAASIGADLAAVGIDLGFAPDADVNSNPSNPVIGVRSFGSDATLVAEHTAAWVEGLQSAGVAACAKHFPGHGDTSIDSHLALPLVTEDPHLHALEPFKAAIRADVRAIMSAHILVPSIDDVPATVSERIMTDLLRGELGFTGLAVTDGLEMRGLSDAFGVAEGAVRALMAGCDALCIGGGLAGEDIVEEVGRAIVAAVNEGRLPEERLTGAAARVDALAAWRSARARVEAANRDEIGLEAARHATHADGAVEVGDDPVVAQLIPASTMASGKIPWGVSLPLEGRGARATTLEFSGPPVDVERIVSLAAGRSLVLVVRDLHRHPWQVEAADVLLARRPDAVVVEMGLPACRPAGAKAYVTTHGASRVSGQAAAEVLRP